MYGCWNLRCVIRKSVMMRRMVVGSGWCVVNVEGVVVG